MWIRSRLKNIQMEQWHHADISGASKLGFSTAIHHTLESSVFPSLIAFKQYQTSPLELFLATLYSCEDSSLDEIQPAESLISCSWSQKFLFDVAFSKNPIIFGGKIFAALWAQVLKPVHFWSLTIITIFWGKVLGVKKNSETVFSRHENVGYCRQDSQFCLHCKVEDIN